MNINVILDNVEKHKPIILDHADWSENKGYLHPLVIDALTQIGAVSYTHLTLPTTPYV